MPIRDYYIGTSVGTLVKIKSLLTKTGNPNPNPTPMTPYTEIVGKDLNGANIESGFSKTTWQWDFLHKDDIEQLLAYCPNASASIVITTRIYDPSGTFQTFSGTMQRPTYDPPSMACART